MVHAILYGWNGNMLVKAPGEYEYKRLMQPDWDLLPSKMITLRAASLIMFGEHPKPRIITRELEEKWLPRGTKVRYIH